MPAPQRHSRSIAAIAATTLSAVLFALPAAAQFMGRPVGVPPVVTSPLPGPILPQTPLQGPVLVQPVTPQLAPTLQPPVVVVPPQPPKEARGDDGGGDDDCNPPRCMCPDETCSFDCCREDERR